MKKIITSLIIIISILFTSVPQVFAGYVNGYYRSNGTYVNGYYRTEADGSPYNNYSYPGNYNPNTGKITGGNADTYLNNYYNNSSGGSYTPSYNSYSYPTTPTCPSNSYYDGVSSCKCSYGYSVSGGSCVSNDTQCQNQIGYSSSYDSLNDTCKCNSGYVIGSSGQCKLASLVCSDQIGLMSQYNSSTKKCECMSGYEFNGSSCEYKSNNSYSSYNSTNSNTCPINSSINLVDNKCYCNSGYQISPTKNSCISIPIKTNDQACIDTYGLNSNWDGTKTNTGLLNCGCQSGYNWNSTKTSCVVALVQTSTKTITTNIPSQNTDLICKTSYGTGSELQGNLCYCSKNYKWNSAIDSCVLGNPIFTKYLSIGYVGNEVVALKNFLAIQKLYSGYVNTPYDKDTTVSVKLFQNMNNITPTGNIGPITRTLLNQLSSK